MTKEKLLEGLKIAEAINANYTINPDALKDTIKALEENWIPVKFRKLTEEEKKIYKEREIFEGVETAWDCLLPDDGQDVLITTTYGDVMFSTFCVDEYDGMYFEDVDDEYVKAWMPLPEPYKEAAGHDKSQ